MFACCACSRCLRRCGHRFQRLRLSKVCMFAIARLSFPMCLALFKICKFSFSPFVFKLSVCRVRRVRNFSRCACSHVHLFSRFCVFSVNTSRKVRCGGILSFCELLTSTFLRSKYTFSHVCVWAPQTGIPKTRNTGCRAGPIQKPRNPAFRERWRTETRKTPRSRFPGSPNRVLARGASRIPYELII